MPLSKSKLLKELRIFGDPEYSGYTQYPENRDKARKEWAKAFSSYIKDLEVDSPGGTTDPTKKANTSGCEGAFYSTIQFPTYGTPQIAAKDYSDAWKAACNAIVLEPGGNYAGVAVNEILSVAPITGNISGQYAGLYADLLKIFTSYQAGFPGNTCLQQLTKIADAFHKATEPIGVTTCTYKNPGQPPVLSGPLVYK